MKRISHKSLISICIFICSAICFSVLGNNEENDPGEQLFKDNCAMCHTNTKTPKVGPGLLGITQRQTKEEIIAWTTNHRRRIAYGDEYSKKVYEAYGKTDVAPIFLSEQQLQDLYAYLKQNDLQNLKSK